MNAPLSYSGSRPTVGFQEMKDQIALLSLGVNSCNPCPPQLTRKPKPCSKKAKNVNGKEPLETTTPTLTQSTVWQGMSRPLSSGCKQDTLACERTWSELASWTLHSAIAKKGNRRSTTSSRTVSSVGNRDTSYGRRMSQQAVGNRRIPVLHHPIHGSMWIEGLSMADRPQKKKKNENLRTRRNKMNQQIIREINRFNFKKDKRLRFCFHVDWYQKHQWLSGHNCKWIWSQWTL